MILNKAVEDNNHLSFSAVVDNNHISFVFPQSAIIGLMIELLFGNTCLRGVSCFVVCNIIIVNRHRLLILTLFKM